MKFLAINPP